MRQAGLTLIELMVTISIAAILLAVAAPGFQHVSSKVKRSAAVTGVMGSIYFTRSEALKRGIVLTLCASENGTSCRSGDDPEWNVGWIVFEDADEDKQVDAGEEVLRVYSFDNPGYSLSGDGSLAKGIVFGAGGFPRVAGQLAYVESGVSSPCTGSLALNVVGRITVNFNHDHCTW